jgi:hypothetical protein
MSAISEYTTRQVHARERPLLEQPGHELEYSLMETKLKLFNNNVKF